MRKPLLISLGLLAAGAGVYAYACREARQYRSEFLKLDDGLNERTPGKIGSDSTKSLKILHISDLHLSRNESQKKLDFLKRVTDDDYDFVFLTGDIFQHDESIKYAPLLLSRKPKYGAYAVLGNHDYYSYSMTNKIIGRIFRFLRHPAKKVRNTAPLIDALESVGYDVLRNEARYLDTLGICMVGVDWPGIEKNRLLELVSRSPGDWLVMALLHLPRDLEFYDQAGVHFAFGGHTHGGQIRVPGFGAIITDSELQRHEASGMTRRGRTIFHISRGMSADPRTNFRLFCPPQASILEVPIPSQCILSNAAVSATTHNV